MNPVKYFEMSELVEPHCNGCQHIIHYERDTVYDNKKQVLTCKFCGTVV